MTPTDPRSAEIVEAPDATPEPAKPSVTGTVAGGDEDRDDEQSDPGGDSDTTEPS